MLMKSTIVSSVSISAGVAIVTGAPTNRQQCPSMLITYVSFRKITVRSYCTLKRPGTDALRRNMIRVGS
uniref:Putative secreted protein n=1 Tax=Anopheles triannulatus TaxID=58253 RepID=A0A2M4B676_9DIPT